MQRGFTENTSCLNTGLLVSEFKNESKVNKTPVFMVTQDGQRAFDEVWTKSMLRKVFFSDIPSDFWQMLSSLYSNATTRVKWDNQLSDSFPLYQGVRQGGILSSHLYKQFNNDLLDTLQNQDIGANIGHIKIPAPTCADDICCLTDNPADLQTCLYIVENFVNKERCKINGSKSDIVRSNTRDIEFNCWEICGQKIEEKSETTHLGITRKSNDTIDIDSVICKSRKTLYSLFGAGLHGKNGLNPVLSKHIWSTFVTPRSLYGLEIMNLRDKHIKQLEQHQQNILKQLQWLPDRCANVAVYLLLGIEPIELQMDKKVLTLFGQISRDRNSLEYQIAQRQIAIHDINSPSWFSLVRRTLMKYELPSALQLLEDPIPKNQWKKLLDTKMNEKWHNLQREEKVSKSSLKYLSTKFCQIGSAHLLWKSVGSNPLDVQKASVKARILTGSYTLQANRSKFNQHDVNPLCPLCKKDIEDRKHFILKCESTDIPRQKYLPKIQTIIRDFDLLIRSEDSEQLLQFIIDASDFVPNYSGKNQQVLDIIEKLTRDLIYDIHRTHLQLSVSAQGSH